MENNKPDYVAKKYPYTTLMNCEFYNHRHSFWEIIICLSGNANHYVNNIKYKFSESDIIIMKPDSFHDYKITGDENKYLHYDLYATAQDMKKALDYYSPKLYETITSDVSPICFSLESASLELLKTKLNKLNSIQITPQFDALSLNLYHTVLSIICGLITENDTIQKNSLPVWLTTLLTQMASPEVLCEKLEKVVELSGFSHAHLCKIFKKNTGKTLTEYFTLLKMDYASVLLKNSKLNILDISMTLGYDSLSHFIRLFKKYNGITPKAYRKKLLNI